MFQVKANGHTVLACIPWGEAADIALVLREHGFNAVVSRDRGGHVWYAGRELAGFSEIAEGLWMDDNTFIYVPTKDRRAGTNGVVKIGDNEFAQQVFIRH